MHTIKKHLFDKTIHVERTGTYIVYTACGLRLHSIIDHRPRYIIEDTSQVTCGGCKRSVQYKEAEDAWYVVEREIKKQLG